MRLSLVLTLALASITLAAPASPPPKKPNPWDVSGVEASPACSGGCPQKGVAEAVHITTARSLDGAQAAPACSGGCPKKHSTAAAPPPPPPDKPNPWETSAVGV
jgi:hypothetical protein